MNTSIDPSSFRIRMYWSLWLAVVTLTLVLKFTVFRGDSILMPILLGI